MDFSERIPLSNTGGSGEQDSKNCKFNSRFKARNTPRDGLSIKLLEGDEEVKQLLSSSLDVLRAAEALSGKISRSMESPALP
jgi:hypothetical protein